jgi:tryptophan synthase beta chain
VIFPAPRPEAAPRCEETGEPKVILTALCGHGLLDLAAYGSYQAGQATDFELPEQVLTEALSGLPSAG